MTDELFFIKNNFYIVNKNDIQKNIDVSLLYNNEKSYTIHIKCILNDDDDESGWDSEIILAIFDENHFYKFDIIIIQPSFIPEYMKQHHRYFISCPFQRSTIKSKSIEFDFPYDAQFIKYMYPFWNDYLSYYAPIPEYSFFIPQHAKKYCIIQEYTKNPFIVFTVKNLFTHMSPDWGLIIIHSSHNKEFMDDIFISFRNSNITFIMQNDDTSILTNIHFFNQLDSVFHAESILIANSNTMYLSHTCQYNIDEYLKYDFVASLCHPIDIHQPSAFPSIRTLHMLSDINIVRVKSCIKYMKWYPIEKFSNIHYSMYLSFIFKECVNVPSDTLLSYFATSDNQLPSTFIFQSGVSFHTRLKTEIDKIKQKYEY
jgi:hypothetical protein